MVASPPRITMATKRIDSSRTKELGSMKLVQLPKQGAGQARHHGRDDPNGELVVGCPIAEDLNGLLILSDGGKHPSER